MGLYSEEWWFANGELAANQRAAVFEENQNVLVPIFSDPAMTVPIVNPTTTDSVGILTFYVADGSYWIFVGPVNNGNPVLVTVGASPTNPVLSVNGELPDGGGNVTLDSADIGAQPIAALTTKGDLYVATAASTTTRRSVGADGEVLTADSGDPTGVSWQAGGSGAVDSVNGQTGVVVLTSSDVGAQPIATINAKGDLYAGTANDATSRLAVGTDGQYLRAASAQATGLEYHTVTASDVGAVPTTRTLTAGTAMTGGGDLSADRTFNVNIGTTAGTAAAGDDSRITGAQQRSALTTKGDVYVATASATTARQAVGTDGQVLTADSAQATGIKWATPTAAPVTSVNGQVGVVVLTPGDVGAQSISTIDAKGDLYAGTGADATTRLPVGTDTFILSANSAQATGLEWIANTTGDVVGPASATDNAVARFDGTTGKLIQNSNLALSDGGSLGFTAQAATAYSNGQLFYNSTFRTLSFDNDEADIRINIGQELWLEVRNTTGSTITKRQVVYINGSHASGLPTVALALANAFTTSLAVGAAAHDIENNSNGFITIYGALNNVDTSAFSAADALYLSPGTPGAMTATKPTAPNFSVRVGAVVNSNPSTGRIAMTPQDRLLGFGTANQVLGMDAAGTAQEYKTLNGTSNRLTVTHAANSVTFDVSSTLMDTKTDKSTLTTKGDIYAATAASTPARQAVGSNGQVLSANSAQSTGLEWIAAPVDSGAQQRSTLTAKGDLYVATASATTARQAVGTDGYELFADSTVTNGLKWAIPQVNGIYPRSTGYSPTGAAVTTRSSKTATQDTMYLIPFYLLIGATLSSIAYEVSGAVALAVVRTGIYASDSTFLPTGAAVADYGTTVSATTGTKTVAVSTALTPGLWFLAFVGQTAAPTIRFGSGSPAYVASATFPSGSSAGWDNGYAQTGVTGGLPSIGSLTDTDTPMCGVKF